MYSGISSIKAKAAQALNSISPAETSTDSGEAPAGASDFNAMLQGILHPDAANKVSEEELFAGLAYERINKLKGKDAADKYKTALEAEQSALKKSDGYIPQEQAAINALNKLTQDGVLTAEEGDKVYAQAFAGAQLDGDASSLFDNRGGANDPTIAVELMETALIAAKALVDGFDSGDKTPDTRSLSGAAPTGKGGGGSAAAMLPPSSGGGAPVTPAGDAVDGPAGFLWKPVSNNQGALAVLLPPELTGSIDALKLLDSEGNVIEEGVFSSNGAGEGERTKYNFRRTGGEYGDNITVRAELTDGTVRTWMIPDGSRRYD